MSTESPSDIIKTATVAIFSPDMKSVILIVHERLGMILPPGWKMEPSDADIFATAVREVREEIWVNLLEIKGSFLDENGWNSRMPVIISKEEFFFSNTHKNAINSLYFFRLASELHSDALGAELQWFYYTKEQILQEKNLIWDREYIILDPNTKEKILTIM